MLAELVLPQQAQSLVPLELEILRQDSHVGINNQCKPAKRYINLTFRLWLYEPSYSIVEGK